MTIDELLTICKHWSSLGSAIQEQVESAVGMDLNAANYNPNASRYIIEFLEATADFVDEDVWELIDYVEES